MITAVVMKEVVYGELSWFEVGVEVETVGTR
jgi:hypothetical protein